MTKNAAKTEEAQSSAVAKTGSSAVALPMEDLIGDVGAGLEEVGAEDIAIPYLSIVQKQSKRMDAPDFKGKPGMFVHTITGECFDGQSGVDVVPVHFRRFWREITTDAQNPKFIAEHPANWPIAQDAVFDSTLRRHICHDGTHANQIMRFYCLLVSPVARPEPVCITFKGSQIKVAKNWNSMLTVQVLKLPDGSELNPAPIYASLWNLSTVPHSNDDGSWHGYQLSSRGMLDPCGVQADADVYVQARDLQKVIAEGVVVEEGDEE